MISIAGINKIIFPKNTLAFLRILGSVLLSFATLRILSDRYGRKEQMIIYFIFFGVVRTWQYP